MPITKISGVHGWTNVGREIITFNGQLFARNAKWSQPISFAAAVEMLSAPWAVWKPGGDEVLDRAVEARLAARGYVRLDNGRNWLADAPEPVGVAS